MNLAPNGKPSNLTHEQWHLVRTPSFKKWFGDWEKDPETASKVVDENGEPLAVYHGTKDNFSIFDKKKVGSNTYNSRLGFYFSNNVNVATSYTYDENDETYSGITLNCFLNIRFPRIIDVNNSSWSDEDLKGVGIDEQIKLHLVNNYDGVIVKNISDPYYPIDDVNYLGNTYVVIEPKQIKLADGTNTTFDSNNPDIRYANGGELYHGSQKSFNKFKTNLIDRTDYGWGLYFSDSEEVAKYYARRPFDRPIIFKTIWESYFTLDEKSIIISSIRKNLLDINKSKKELDKKFHPLINKIESIIKDKGFIYKVEVEKGLWLYWDEKVPNSIKKMFQNVSDEFFENGETFYRYLTNKQKSEKKASLLLLSKGISGIKYSISNNRFDIKGYNYVIFNADDITIEEKEKYAKGGLTMPTFIAPNGNRSNLIGIKAEDENGKWVYLYDIVRTDKFKEWFGDWEEAYITKDYDDVSKIIDENGEPSICYHTTSNEFFEFSENFIGSRTDAGYYGKGFYFTEGTPDSHYGEREIPCLLNIRNPYLKQSSYRNYELNSDDLKSKEFDGVIVFSDIENIDLTKGLGYRGNRVEEIVAYYPEQIKLADATNTTFDKYNPDIRYEIGGIFHGSSPYEVEVQHLLNSKETKKIMSSLGSKKDINYWVEKYHSKTKNHKKNTYYRVERGSGKGYGGFGKGLYLGRDKYALSNFYDNEQEGLPITEYYGSPKWLDLTSYKKEKSFINILKRNGIDIINSKEVSSIVTEMGYDGIRYYDPLATGEEFVLFNTDKLIKVDKISYSVGGELTLTSEQVENELSRKLHWWNDDVVSINGIEYKKVFLRNEYKRL